MNFIASFLLKKRLFATVTFVEKGVGKVVEAAVGSSLLDVAHENKIDLEGACEGSVACSTCHVILDQKTFDSLPEPSDEENDMLDLAFGLTETSRLGCQVKILEPNQEIIAKIPSATRNIK